jgi:NAD(P)H-flavin reductase
MPSSGAHSFHPARLVRREDAGGGLVRIALAANPETTNTHVSPGQYIEVRVGEETAFFVLSNEPGASSWELVMRAGGGASDILVGASPGQTLEVTGALGEGFRVIGARGHPLVIVLGGSGIAAGPGLVRRRVLDGEAPRTRVLVGVRTRDEFGMRQEVEAWIQAGVPVLVCLSNDDRTIDGIECAQGYVQDVLRVRAEAVDLKGAFIFAVGADSMVDALRRLASELGIEPGRVQTNH